MYGTFYNIPSCVLTWILFLVSIHFLQCIHCLLNYFFWNILKAFISSGNHVTFWTFRTLLYFFWTFSFQCLVQLRGILSWRVGYICPGLIALPVLTPSAADFRGPGKEGGRVLLPFSLFLQIALLDWFSKPHCTEWSLSLSLYNPKAELKMLYITTL